MTGKAPGKCAIKLHFVETAEKKCLPFVIQTLSMVPHAHNWIPVLNEELNYLTFNNYVPVLVLACR